MKVLKPHILKLNVEELLKFAASVMSFVTKCVVFSAFISGGFCAKCCLEEVARAEVNVSNAATC